MKFVLVTYLILFTFGFSAKASPDRLVPVNLKCEYRINPLDVENLNPRLSWELNTIKRGQKQTAYEIIVSSSKEYINKNNADLWKSGKIKSNQSNNIAYNGTELTSETNCWWKVRFWDKNGKVSKWSEPAFWKMGLLEKNDWHAKWIGHDCNAAPLFRKEFNIKKSIKEAYIYISGLGYYELYFNGEKVGDHVLDPGQTDYEQRVFYITYNVTENLKSGKNVAGAILGNGWYNQNAVNHGKFGWDDVVYGNPRFIAQLHITYKDGTEDLIITDETWKCSASPIVANNIYAGEVYDARLEQPGWNNIDFDDSTWDIAKIKSQPGGHLVSQKIQPIRKIQSIKPKSISNPKKDVYVFDMGQNFAGWVKLNNLNEKKGTEIQLKFSESLKNDGMIEPASTGVYATNVIQTDRYICKGSGSETWEPRFTYHGFRYVEVTGLQNKPKLANLEGIVVNSDVGKAGEFECSDSMLNKIHQTAIWTQLSNMHSVPTDCPHRERCGWLGDAHLCAEMAIFNFNSHLFWKKFVRDIETSRHGGIPAEISPGKRWGGEPKTDWGSAFILLPWYIYLYYGDISAAQEHWEGMTFFMQHCEKIADNFIIKNGHGDLFAPGSVKPLETPIELTSTALFYYDAQIMAFLAKALGKENDEKKYISLAENIKTAFINNYYNKKEKTFGSQTANTIALFYNIFPENDEFQIAKNLSVEIEQNDFHHATGIIGSRHLYWVLGKYGYGLLAKRMLNNTTYPGFGDLFNKGATTCWEYWGEEEIDSTSLGVRSKSHPFQGAFNTWFFNGISGIIPDPENPGFKHILLKPQLTNDLTFAKANYHSIYGTIVSEWDNNNNVFEWHISVPANTTASIYIPSEKTKNLKESNMPIKHAGVESIKKENGKTIIEIGSGEYNFSWIQNN